MSAAEPVKPRRPRKKPEGRFHHGDLAEQLVVAAAQLVEKRGHAELSLRELADRLGVSQPAIYRHFESRDALLAEVALRGFAAFIDALRAAVAETRDPFDGALAYGKAYVRFAVAHPNWFRLHFSRAWTEELARREGIALRLVPAEAARQEFLASLRQMLPPDDERVADLYRLVWATAHGLATFVVERVFQLVQTDEERIAAADEALQLLVDSLRARAEPKRR